jgi:2-polyprenyl-3-methyl-5-hydroxy-6-metoxy-1,4-benzoquinol methylase
MNVAPGPASVADQELKQKHKAMWATGDYPVMVETFLLPLGPRLVEACGIGPGMRVLDVAAGTGNAALRAAAAGADVVASDLTPRLLEAGRERADAEGLTLQWEEASATVGQRGAPGRPVRRQRRLHDAAPGELGDHRVQPGP